MFMTTTSPQVPTQSNPLFEQWAHLLHLCGEWRELSNREGAAIAAGQWTQVAEAQLTKESLQKQIGSSISALRKEAAQEGTDVTSWLQGLGAELIAIEEKNCRLLKDQETVFCQQSKGLQKSRRSLRQMQKAYTGAAAPVWHSYS
jgi:hypothetical protein